MLIYSKNQGPRLRYLLDFIFGEAFGTTYRLTDRPEELETYNGCRIAYTPERLEGAFHIPDSGLLHETGVRELEPDTGMAGDMKVLFPAAAEGEHPFDVCSAVFYMISRYEEYLPFKADRYGRFDAGASLACREGFLDEPIVDVWLKDLRERIMAFFPGQHLREAGSAFIPTIDVDHPFAVLYKNRVKVLAGNVRARFRSRSEWKQRKEILQGRARDPFDTFDDIEWLHASRKLVPRVFYLCAGPSRHDSSLSPRHGAFRDLVLKTTRYAATGIHPSFHSHKDTGVLEREMEILAGITGERPLASRQHYLKFRLPRTYRDLIEKGIREDYSMGFASAAGFRSGTSRPYHFYDMGLETGTALRVYPLQIMDRTLKDYMGLSPEEAFRTIRRIVDGVAQYGGTLVSLWHNEAFSDHGEWAGWREVYLRMLDYIAEKKLT
jgi:hypothetical protein